MIRLMTCLDVQCLIPVAMYKAWRPVGSPSIRDHNVIHASKLDTIEVLFGES